jgi:hypothetical protein
VARSRDTDGRLTVVPWTEEFALRSLRLEPSATREERLSAFRAALARGDERLPDGAVEGAAPTV